MNIYRVTVRHALSNEMYSEDLAQVDKHKEGPIKVVQSSVMPWHSGWHHESQCKLIGRMVNVRMK